MIPAETRAQAAAPIERRRRARGGSPPGWARRGPITRTGASREASDRLLAELTGSRYSAAGWARFLWRSSQRSWEQALAHRRAALEVTAASVGLGATGHRWAGTLTWCLAITHLGMLGEGGEPLGWPNRLTLLRANLPALAGRTPAPAALLALGSDFLDGRLARGLGETTGFGAFADGLADAAFWSWFLIRFEPSAVVRALALAIWAGPPVAITAAYFKAGRTIDFPRFEAFRQLSVGCQLLVAARAIRHDLRAPASAGPAVPGEQGGGLRAAMANSVVSA